MKKDKKGSKRSTATRNVTNISPYQTSIYTLTVGSQAVTYSIPRHFVEKEVKVNNAHSPWDNMVKLPDVDDIAGHTLVHYLYTGDYETLSLELDSEEENRKMEYRISVFVYCAAKSLDLGALEKIAAKCIEETGTQVSVNTVLSVVSEANKKLPEDNTFLIQHLRSKIEAAFEDDPSLFRQDSFFDAVADPSFHKVLMKMMAELYYEKDLKAQEKLTPVVPQLPEVVEIAVADGGEIPEVDDWGFTWGTTSKDKKKKKKAAKIDEAEVVPVPDTMEVVQDDAAELQAKDNWDFYWGASEKKKKQASTAIADEPVPERAIIPEVDAQAPVDDGWGSWGRSASSKSEEKHSEAIDPVPELESVEGIESQAAEDNGWGSWGRSTAAKSKATTLEVIEDQLVPETEPEPIKEDVCDFSATPKKNKSKKVKKKVSRWAEYEPVPEPEVVVKAEVEAKDPMDDIWGFTSKANKSKTKKTAKLVENEPVTELEVNKESKALTLENELAEWGLPSKKDKKRKKTKAKVIEDEPVPEPELVVVEEPIVESQSIAKINEIWSTWGLATEKKIASKSEQDEANLPEPESDPEIIENIGEDTLPIAVEHTDTATSAENADEDGLCPDRAKHLLGGDMWKECKRCRAMICQVSRQLAQQASGSEAEYEIVERIITG